MRIPKTIWQTYRSRHVPTVAHPCMQSWRRVAKGWEYRFFDDEEISAFVSNHFTAEEFQVFSELPLGVMKADFWRYAVLYHHGGIYADIDAICLIPPDLWCRQESGLVIGVEDTRELFCQWVLAAVPGHPVLRRALDLIVQRSRTGMEISDPRYVHYRTGPKLWSDAVCDVLELERIAIIDPERPSMKSPSDLTAQQILESKTVWSGSDIWIHPWAIFCGGAVGHTFASQRWQEQPLYTSWRVEHEREAQASVNDIAVQ